MSETRGKLRVITAVRPDLSAFERGPICADFDEDCAGMTQEEREWCAAGCPGNPDYEVDYAGPCPYVRGMTRA